MDGNGAEVVCRALAEAGARCVFGLPGTQNLELFEALRRSPLRTVVATHELAASFMANGYGRVSGQPGILLTIPGPGFTYALTGLAEARLDSAPLLHLTLAPASQPGNAYQLQALDQAAVARPLVKRVIEVEEAAALGPAVQDAFRLAAGGEPGPVLLQLRGGLMGAPAPYPSGTGENDSHANARATEVAELLGASRRVLLLVGQGAAGSSEEVRTLAERLHALVVTTTSGRGILAEDHPRSLGFEFGGTRAAALNELIAASDLVLALGCKFSHNGSRGFQLNLPKEKLIQVDASEEVLERNYAARIALRADARAFLVDLLPRLKDSTGWPDEEGVAWRERGQRESWADAPEPTLAGRSAGEFFTALQGILARDVCLVTDSGLHQMLARRHLRVLAPNGLLVPTNLQSMGFAIPAAIGAKLASPDRQVVALLGDGGMLMSGAELATAVKLGIDLCVLVLNDGAYGLIRRSQLSAWGNQHGSTLHNPDFETLAASYGAHYVRTGSDPAAEIGRALELRGTTLVEVTAHDTARFQVARAKGLVKRLLRKFGLRRA